MEDMLLLDGAGMARLEKNPGGFKEFGSLLESVCREAEKALGKGPFSVTRRKQPPMGGDGRNFASFAPYWWPDPESPDGLPFHRKDGEVNPQSITDDLVFLKEMTDGVKNLAEACYFTGRVDYGRHAARLLKKWFLDPDTGMIPNLEYAQCVPGLTEGRGRCYGIITSREWVLLPDMVKLLECRGHTVNMGGRCLKGWFSDFLQWLKTSSFGRQEESQENNHGTWYDAQVIAYALFTGETETALKQAEEKTLSRIASHFTSGGEQPLELSRTRSWTYSLMNLKGFAFIAGLAENLGMDLWNYEDGHGRGIRKGIHSLLPFALGEKEWPHPQINGEFPVDDLLDILLLAMKSCGGEEFSNAYRLIKSAAPPSPWRLALNAGAAGDPG